MPELLVVVGILALLIAIMLPPLQLARRQARSAVCKVNLQQLGIALQNIFVDYDFFPLWDDGCRPTRYTWIDLLVENDKLRDPRAGYCPDDPRPDAFNSARGVFHHVYRRPGVPGTEYSYGIGVPLSAGGWVSGLVNRRIHASAPRLFANHEDRPAERVLVADANWTHIYNLNGAGFAEGAWNDPSQFDNMVAWNRHPHLTANFLMQDFHVDQVSYRFADSPVDGGVDTYRHFVWQPGEPIDVGPDDEVGGYLYPDIPSVSDDFAAGTFPRDLVPRYYTLERGWYRVTRR